MNDKIDHSGVDDMCIVTDEFEVLWVEIKNKKKEKYFNWMYLSSPKH